MLRLLPPEERIPCILHREIFLQKIPLSIRNSLGQLTDPDKDIRHLAKRVDRLIASRASAAAGACAVETAKTSKKSKKKKKAEGKVEAKASNKEEIQHHPN